MDVITAILNGVLIISAIVLIWLVVGTFSGSRKRRYPIAPWGVIVAVLSCIAGLALIAFAFFNLTATILIFSARARSHAFALFFSTAQLSILVLPPSFFVLPVSGSLVFRVAFVFMAVKIGEMIFYDSILAYAMLPVILLVFLFSLFTDVRTARLHDRSMQTDVPVSRRNGVFAFDKLATSNAFSPGFEGSGTGSLTPTNGLVGGASVRGSTLTVLLLESVLLALVGTGCSESYLTSLLGLFVLIHGPMCYANIA